MGNVANQMPIQSGGLPRIRSKDTKTTVFAHDSLRRLKSRRICPDPTEDPQTQFLSHFTIDPGPMNRITTAVTCILLLFCALPDQSVAQIFGLRGGVERTQIVSDLESGQIGTETGYAVGAFINIPLPKNFGLSVEGLYSQKVVTQQNLEAAQGGAFDPTASLHLGYIQMPITASYRFPVPGPLKPRLYGGPVIGVVVDESVDLNGKRAGDVANEAAILTRDAFNEREIGWIAGAGATLGFRGFPVYLMFDLRYIGGVSTISDDFAGNPLARQLEVGAFSGMIGIGF